MMKRLGDAHSNVMPKEIAARQPRTLGQPEPVREKRDDRDKSEEKGEGK